MTSHEHVLARDHVLRRLMNLTENQQVSPKVAAEIAAALGLTALNVEWWRNQCDDGLPCIRLRRDRFIALKIVLDVIEKVIHRADMPHATREQMIEQAVRRGVRFTQQHLKSVA